MNRPRNIGTAAETAVVKALRTNGFGTAERRSLKGNLDQGDITGTPGIAWEVKGGAAAKDMGPGLLTTWLAQTETERRNAGAVIGILVIARRGIGATNAHRWWAITTTDTLAALWLATDPSVVITPGIPIRLELGHLCTLLRGAGYGDPLSPAVTA